MFKAKIKNEVLIINEQDGVTQINGKPFHADVLEFSQDKYHILIDNRSYTGEILNFDKETKTCQVKVNSRIITVELKDRYDELLHEIGIDETAGKKVNTIKAPMPGMVLKVMVENGQPIKKGDAIVVLEAMKMENILKSPADGIVKRVHVNKGDKVEKNQIMVHLD